MKKIVTWQSPNGERINLTRSQIRRLERASVWPKDSRGMEFCAVSHGLRNGWPTLADAEIDALINP